MQKTKILLLLLAVTFLTAQNLIAQSGKIFTSEFHKENAGKILFSDKPIEIGKEDPAQFKTTFKPNDKIYAVAYLKDKYENFDGAQLYGYYPMVIDKNFLAEFFGVFINLKGYNKTHRIEFKNKGNEEQLSFRLMELIPDPQKARRTTEVKEFGEILSELSPKKNHKLHVGFRGSNSVMLAKGKIKLEYKGFDGGEIKKNNEIAYQNALDFGAAQRELPERFYEKENIFSDPELSKANIEKLILSSSKFGELVDEILKIHISGTEPEWSIRKKSNGTPTAKITDRYIGFIYKGKDGWCYYVDYVSIIKDYEGGGNYSKARYSNYRGSTRIHCDKAVLNN